MAKKLDTSSGAALNPPRAHHAPWALCSLGAFLHYVPENPAADALRELHDEHKRELPTAEVAIAEAYVVLDRCGALDEFRTWSKENGGYAVRWPYDVSHLPEPI